MALTKEDDGILGAQDWQMDEVALDPFRNPIHWLSCSDIKEVTWWHSGAINQAFLDAKVFHSLIISMSFQSFVMGHSHP